MANGFVYELTIKELFYLLFGKKTCPKCNSRLVKNKYLEIVDGFTFNTSSFHIYGKGEMIKHYFYSFRCQKCGKEYKLNELSK